MSTPLLHIEHLNAGYERDKPILQDFSLLLHAGDSLGIVGQNGCGKSTLAKAIMGMASYVSGIISWQGQNITHGATHQKRQLGIGYLMQGGKIFGNLSVEDNIKFALLDQRNVDYRSVIKEWQLEDIALLKNDHRLKMKASFLSGGERHILALLMVILANPHMKLLIADEPSAGVAAGVQVQLLNIMKKYILEKQLSLLLIEHNVMFLNALTNNNIKI
jgi:ABC-type branched-subunit amino acid transport system ATPase component